MAAEPARLRARTAPTRIMTEGFPRASVAKNQPANAMQEVGVRSLGREDPLEKEMATHPGILATASLTYQRHHGKFPQVPGRSQGK